MNSNITTNLSNEAQKPLLRVGAVSGSLSFKEQIKQDIIPIIWQMAEKEKDHLNWLINNNAPKDMIETSQRYLSHFRQRHKEYIDYADGL
jgi:hypothetical protein